MGQFEFIEQLGYDLKKDEFEMLQGKHHYISEKLVVDAINGIKVVAKDLNKVAKSNELFGGRVWDSVTGNGKKRQNLINENIIEGLSAVTTWLRDHDQHLSRIDMRIKDVADELFRTQDEIFEFYEQHKELKIDVEKLKNDIQDFKREADNRFEVLEKRLQNIEAQNHIDREVSSIGTLGLPTEIEIFTILDNLASGEFGIWLMYEKSSHKKEAQLLYLKRKIKEKLKIENKEFIDYVKINHDIQKLSEIEKKAIGFISSQYSLFANSNDLHEISDMIKTVALSEPKKVEAEIDKQSHISTFKTLETYIDDATKELFAL